MLKSRQVSDGPRFCLKVDCAALSGLSGHSRIMDGSRVTDFSIERILSPQLGLRPSGMDFSPGGYLQGIPELRPPPPVLLPVPGCLQYREMSLRDAFAPYRAGFHHTDLSGVYSNPGVYVHFSSHGPADAQQLSGYQRVGLSAQPQTRQKARSRTVFTDSQTKRLESLFELTAYPTMDARAELARSSGLNEEIVRVWFKNRRARRKRQRSGSKVKTTSPSRSAGAEKKFFTSFL
ncbi:dharma [Pseudoliparis swirei]|uniref:dharma n=1 Tax=Pseudoliparis swirei TaxID=2059687 RepID=UPI0024BD93CD|nr:dharma [Pseudoliparis swirei]